MGPGGSWWVLVGPGGHHGESGHSAVSRVEREPGTGSEHVDLVLGILTLVLVTALKWSHVRLVFVTAGVSGSRGQAALLHVDLVVETGTGNVEL